jgi:dipeptide transport system ATP-binding protein
VALLEIDNLSKNFISSTNWFGRASVIEANKNINLKLEEGKTLAIVGESGSGKTTLAKQIIGIEKPSSGVIKLDDQALRFNNRQDKRKRFTNIRMIFQDPYESLNPNVRIGHALEQPLIINTALTAKQRKQKISDTLIKVGMQSEHQYRYPHMFSGGQRQRIAIARAIILEPRVIIADEPLSSLDVSIQAQILNLMQTLQEEMGISYIFISHDLNIVEHIADSIMVMYRGKVVEQGNVSQIFDEPLHPYTQALFASTPIFRNRFPDFLQQGKRKPLTNEKASCVFAERCPYCEERCQSSSPPLIDVDDDFKIACFKFD